MSKAAELLAKMDEEILGKVNAIAMQKDAEIKAYAQEKYDEAVEEKLAEIKKGVEVEYAVAKDYLNQIIEAEKAVEETHEEEASEVVVEAISGEAEEPKVIE